MDPQDERAVPQRLALTGAALFSGLALLVHILVGAPLPAALAGTVVFATVTAWVVWTRLSKLRRLAVTAIAAVGVRAGVIATAAYDGAKWALSQWDSSPYNPFDAIHVFGQLLVGTRVPDALAYIAGGLFHLVNGIAFGVGYSLLLGNRGVGAGIVWGLGLETFQLALYPDWLRVQFVREFVQISAASHVVYGATLGACVRRGIEGIRRRGIS